jgi:HD-GYP domain-containing protein (c-di-GMP phosphodiesterase class II)
VVKFLRKKYSLQFTISTLFIMITVVLAAILSWQSFSRTSEIMLESAHELYQRETRELSLDFRASYGSIVGSLRQFRLSPVSQAETFEQRIASLDSFQAVLAAEPSVFSVGIGYANGDYLSVSRVDSEYVRSKYDVPTGSAYIVNYIKNQPSEETFKAGTLYTIFYDKTLKAIERREQGATAFDPRSRPWYQQAKAMPAATAPYVFYDSKIVGLTAMSETPVPGAVVVFDITLDHLSKTLSRYRLTPASEAVLINADGQVFAYTEQQKVVAAQSVPADAEKVQTDDFQLATLKQLDSEVLSHVAGFISAEQQALDFDYRGQRWIGSAQVIAKPGGVDLYALMLSPVDELLVDAIAIRNRLLFAAVVVLLIFIPLIWYTAERIATPLHILAREAGAISRFNFDKTRKKRSVIKEVHELDAAMDLMKSTIKQFIQLINSLASEKNLDTLLKRVTRETLSVSNTDAALIYLLDEQDDLLKPGYLCDKAGQKISTSGLSSISLSEVKGYFKESDHENHNSRVLNLVSGEDNKLSPLLQILEESALTVIVLPLENRNNETIGLLCFVDRSSDAVVDENSLAFVEALSGFAAVTLESRQLLSMQEALLHAFIKLIAGAIDAKSPYTGGHCQRVPEITLMLAKAACASQDEKFKQFDLDDDQWEELGIACWLHDCGKVTTPEYVVDKATKLETIYDRIHEVRTRFEVLKRDAEISCWRQIADGGDRESLLAELSKQCRQLDDDFAFVAECNVGSEFMADEQVERLRAIADRSWLRTLDDRLGLSWEELNRKIDRDQADQDQADSEVALPVEEKLLSDKPEHRIVRQACDRIAADNPWGFRLDTPEYKYNRGELYNLSVRRGTLSEEERYMINGHMIQTIIMLNKLPYPKALRNVPLIAGSHHETMDGKGYPKRLKMSEQPLTARMMVIADIFEALTASDRPYKKAKTLSESLRIMSFMRNDRHIDPDLFELFLRSGVYLEYADKFLSKQQIDSVDIEDYLS